MSPRFKISTEGISRHKFFVVLAFILMAISVCGTTLFSLLKLMGIF